MNKTLRVLEILWLIFGVICLALAAYTINQHGIDHTESKMLLFGAFISGVLYSLRRRQRVRSEQNDKPES